MFSFEFQTLKEIALKKKICLEKKKKLLACRKQEKINYYEETKFGATAQTCDPHSGNPTSQAMTSQNYEVSRFFPVVQHGTYCFN